MHRTGPLSPEFWGLNPLVRRNVRRGRRQPTVGTQYVPQQRDLTDLRRQQQAFSKVLDRLDEENRWMAIPALAPVAAVAAGEGAVLLAARLARPLPGGPLVLTRRDFPTGGHYAARAGQRAHAALKARVQAKPGWIPEGRVPRQAPSSGYVRPDVQGPIRPSRPDKRFQMELKPNTPSGQKAARAQVRRYFDETRRKTRAIFHDPEDFP
jgi:hypothetical protein